MKERVQIEAPSAALAPLPRAMRIAALALIMAGCSAPPTKDLPSLDAYAVCSHAYPDGTPMDCNESDSSFPQPSVPSGFSCIDEVAPTRNHGQGARLWGDSNGHYGVELLQAADPPTERIAGRIHLGVGGDKQALNFVGTTGFVAFPAVTSSADRGTWGIRSWGFLATGQPEAISQPNLSILTSSYGDDAWYVWHFGSGTLAYSFQAMARLVIGDSESWLPTSFDSIGSDFELHGALAKKVNAEGDFVLPSAAERLLPSSRCGTG